MSRPLWPHAPHPHSIVHHTLAQPGASDEPDDGGAMPAWWRACLGLALAVSLLTVPALLTIALYNYWPASTDGVACVIARSRA